MDMRSGGVDSGLLPGERCLTACTHLYAKPTFQLRSSLYSSGSLESWGACPFSPNWTTQEGEGDLAGHSDLWPLPPCLRDN